MSVTDAIHALWGRTTSRLISPDLTGAQLDDRRHARDARAVLTSLAAIAARIIALGTSFLAIPLTIGYLGVDQYGLFVSLTALTSMFVFADLGLGNGLLNIISGAVGSDDREAVSHAVSSALFMLSLVAVAGAVLMIAILPRIPLGSLFHVLDGAAAAAATPTAFVLFGAFLLAVPLGVVDRIRLGYQEGYLNSVASAAGGVGSLLALLLAVAVHASLPVLVLAITAPALLATGVNGLVLFRWQRAWLTPYVSLFRRATAVRLARLGFLFLVLQLAVAVAYQSDVVVAAVLFGPAAAATYAITLKFFMVVPTFVSFYLVALWPAYGEAIQRGDGFWVRRTLANSTKLSVAVTGVTSAALALAGGWIIGVWTHGTVNPPPALLLGAALWSVLYSGFNALSMLLNAASLLKVQVVIAAAMAAASLALSVVLGMVAGVSGIVWGTLVAYLLFAAIPLVLYLPRALKRIAPLEPETVA